MTHLELLLTYLLLILLGIWVSHRTVKNIIEAKKELRELRKYNRKYNRK